MSGTEPTPRDAQRGFSGWAIAHPIPPIVLMLVLTLLGLVAFSQLSVNGTPNIDLPVVYATVLQPGAAPADLETQVTQRVEDAVAGVGNISHIRSTVSDGVSCRRSIRC